MILLLNGPFGIGKTTTARLLAQRLPGAMVFDPEIVGAFLTRVLWEVEQVHDFQEFALWPRLTVQVAGMLREQYGRPLIVPMTIANRERLEAIAAGLRAVDGQVVTVQLTASRDVLVERILGRPNEEGPHDWCLEHLEEGLAMAADPAFGVPVATDGRTPEEVADAVLTVVELRQAAASQGVHPQDSR